MKTLLTMKNLAFALLMLFAASCFPTGKIQVERKRVTRATHDPYFPINNGSHSTADCDACHGPFSTFTQFSCITCHEHDQTSTDSAHQSVPDYSYGPDTCYNCHRTGDLMSREAHEQYFPIATGVHSQPGCSQCHVSGYQSFECIQCHDHLCDTSNPQHSGVPGYQCASPSCLTCHPKGTAIKREDHENYFPIVSGAHSQSTCAECHVSGYNSFECIQCHSHLCATSDSQHPGVTGYQCASASCFTCHPKGQVMNRTDHETYFPIATGVHAQSSCAGCHVSGYNSFECIQCHTHLCATSDTQHPGVTGYQCSSPSCLTCHPRGQAMTRAQHAGYFPISSGRHSTISCSDCHPTGYNSYDCVLCHSHTCALMNPHHQEVNGYVCDSPHCKNCHPSGVAGD